MPHVAILITAMLASPALADDYDPVTPLKLHHVSLSGGADFLGTLRSELAIRPWRYLELAATASGTRSDETGTDFDGEYTTYGRWSGTVRAIAVLDRGTKWLFAVQGGVGVGHDSVTHVMRHHDSYTPSWWPDTYEYQDVPEESGAFVRGDAGLTLAVNRVESRIQFGIEGKDAAPYAALTIGIGFF